MLPRSHAAPLVKMVVPSTCIILLFAMLCATLCTTSISAQGNTTVPTLTEILTPSLNGPGNESLRLLFPPAVVSNAQTGIAIRYTLLFALGRYEARAACHPVMLSFFATKDNIPLEFCNPEGDAIIRSYIYYRLWASQFREEAPAYAQFLVRVGLAPFAQTRDTTTIRGWANVAADRLLSYLENDGWNSLGDKSRNDFLQPYSDFTGYKPRNGPLQPAGKLSFPLRWQPLTGPRDKRGEFASQVHVLPQVALEGMPLTVTRDELESRKLMGPYLRPNSKGNIGKQDMMIMNKQLADLLARNRKLNAEQIALAFWWDNKFLSLGNFAALYSLLLGFDVATLERLFLTEVVAQHDAVILAWKEKRRHDLVRPTTMVRRFFKGQTIIAYRGFEKGAGRMRGQDWEAVVPVQPHSEFPSASAIICRISLESLESSLEKILGNKTVPVLEVTISPDTISLSGVDRPVKKRFKSVRQAWKNCGYSRLAAAVHFEPSVVGGFEIAKGLGKKVNEHMDDLFEGRRPEICSRCNKGPIE